MCLILFAWQRHPRYPLILAANRDEFYARPTRDAHWWEDAPIFAGRDLEAGGTWLGFNRRGAFAAVTNVREPGAPRAGKRSRGELTTGYLLGDEPPERQAAALAASGADYAGYNLLLGNVDELWYCSNRDGRARAIEPGIWGVSNGAFDEPWPKLVSGKAELAAAIKGEFDRDALLAILHDDRRADDRELPSTGVPLDIERRLSSRFIRSPDYGTRASTVMLVDRDGRIEFTEQNFPDAERRGALIHEVIVPSL